ncbi:DUF4286 domain-containing protein [Longispora sp. K20-0274]|uniref:DUF4286 domain-containing protein n=1 Tax=Longispora sp. K20-0274 TaxID=3088255 RepID=UPI00399A20F9
MLVYAVRTSFADPAERDSYLDWLRGGHVDAVLAGGALTGEVTVLDDGSVESRYTFASRDTFAAYESGAALKLRAEGAGRFPGAVFARSVGERIVSAGL